MHHRPTVTLLIYGALWTLLLLPLACPLGHAAAGCPCPAAEDHRSADPCAEVCTHDHLAEPLLRASETAFSLGMVADQLVSPLSVEPPADRDAAPAGVPPRVDRPPAALGGRNLPLLS